MRFALPILLLAAPALGAQEPKPTVEQLVAKVADLRKQQSELKKQEDGATAELRAELKRLQELVAALDLDAKPPKPPEPTPTDPLRAKLKLAYDADGAPAEKKREHARDLAALYRQAAKLAADEGVVTSGELLRRVREASAGLVGADALRECRRAVGAELGVLLPTDDALTPAQRVAAAALFARLADTFDSF